MLLAAMAQLFGVVSGPLDHWRTPSRIGIHAETQGSRTSHYAHNEDTCVACAMLQVVASPARRLVVATVQRDPQFIARARHVWAPPSILHAAAPPRGPPAVSKLG